MPNPHRRYSRSASQPQSQRGHLAVPGSRRLSFRAGRLAFVALAFALALLNPSGPATAAVLLGSQTVGATRDSNAAGRAEAFVSTATASGTAASIAVYVDSTSASTKLVAGVYADSAGHPGPLLTQGSLASPVKGAWNTVTVPAAAIAAGQKYWIAILGASGGGTLVFRNVRGGGPSEASSSSTLATLPATWVTGAIYATDSPASAYVNSTSGTTPALTLSQSGAVFAYTTGGAVPAAQTVSLTNTGGGTLAFTATSNASWLGVSPASGSAPATLALAPNVSGLAVGTYSGQVTVTAPGASGSPASIAVTLTVASAPTPVLSVAPASVTFSYTVGGAPPGAQTLGVTNTGGGTLAFTATSNASWLGVSPAGGSAPATLTLAPNVSGVAVGTYSGQVTVTASGASGSPATIAVTLDVSASTAAGADWPMVARDSLRQGFAANDGVIDTTNAATLGFLWDAPLNGKVTAQPLYLASLAINGAVHDVVFATTSNDTMYALDANTGQTLWLRSFGADSGTCVINGGTGIRSAPALDRARNRAFVSADDGRLYTVSLTDGTDVVAPIQLIDLPSTNKVRGGLNLNGNDLYAANGSNGCDSAPWRGRIYHLDVSGAGPVLMHTFDVVPSIAGDNRGGGVWSFGGVSVDPATGNVYAATGADANEAYTPYADRMIALDRNLNLLGSYEPPHPTSYPCGGAPCDVDFSATPTIFAPPGCPQMVADGNKSGGFYVIGTADLAASRTTSLQTLTLNTANDGLEAGGVGGVPAYWPAGNMLFVTDLGPGVSGVKAGLVALSVGPAPSCTVSVAWSVAVPVTGSKVSSPTVAGGVVFVGEAGNGHVHAFDATTGTELWNSGNYIAGAVWGAPSIGGGKVFVGAWNGGGAADTGTLWALRPGASTTPPPPPPPPGPVLAVSPAAVGFAYTVGGTAPSPQALSVTNSGSGTMSYTATNGASWLAVTPIGGTAPGSLTLTPGVNGLQAGTYTDRVVVSAAGAASSPASIPVTLTVSASGPPPTCPTPAPIPIGDQSIGGQMDSNPPGQAEAFQATASGCGTVTSISAYIDGGSTAGTITVGLYADNAGHPSTLLAQGSATAPAAGTWVKIPIAPGAAVTQGTPYWIAIMGTGSGTIRFRDRKGGCRAETSAVGSLTTLPVTWATGSSYTDCPLSAYGNTQ